MNIKIILDEQLLKYIFDVESKKLVGICMKRFEIHDNPEDQKKAIKEALYENLRGLLQILIYNGKENLLLTPKKEKE